MTVEELIKKYDLSLIRRDGRVGLQPSRKLTKNEEKEVIEKKEEIKKELLRREAEEKARKEEEAKKYEEEKREIEAGKKKIKVEFIDGEYLSGYTVSGPARILLKEAGVAKLVPGWGLEVSDELVKELGEEFTYPQVLEFIRPTQKEKAKKEAEKEKERAAKFEEARRTGQPVELSRVSVECDGSVDECSADILITYALPNGGTEEKRTHTH